MSLWIINHTEAIPKAGDTFIIDDLEVRIVQATRRSIEQVNAEDERCLQTNDVLMNPPDNQWTG